MPKPQLKTRNLMNDANTTIQNLRDMCLRFREEREWTSQKAATFAKDIAVEAGELLDHFVWEEDAYLHNPEIAKEVNYELVDVFFGILIMSRILNIDLSKTLQQKLAILDKKYPIKKCLERGNGEKQIEWRKWAHQRKKMFKAK